MKRIQLTGKRAQLRSKEDHEVADFYRARTRYRSESGRLRQIERFASTSAQARRKLLEAITALPKDETTTLSRGTDLAALAKRYLETKEGGKTSASTFAAYARAIEKHVTPSIGAIAIVEATPERLQTFLNSVSENNGPASAKLCRSVLSGMLGFAVRMGAITINPVRELERIRQKGQGAQALSPEALKTLLVRVRDDQRLKELDLVDVIEFMTGTGCRLGEALALTWDDIDQKSSTATIGATVFRLTGQGLIRQDHGKSVSSNRTIVMPAPLMALLMKRKTQQTTGTDLVFPTVLGHLRDPQNTERDWRLARERLLLGPIKLHAFRKTVATLLDQGGLSARDIAEYLGHKNPSMTQDKYMSKTAGTTKAAALLSAFIHPSPK